ncbi:MAG: hypothetical protein HY815_17850 [Candidatus Riflebacteria bacterium]|nr:hypothetical protein [Candidatus Riflebacteria bacterium]
MEDRTVREIPNLALVALTLWACLSRAVLVEASARPAGLRSMPALETARMALFVTGDDPNDLTMADMDGSGGLSRGDTPVTVVDPYRKETHTHPVMFRDLLAVVRDSGGAVRADDAASVLHPRGKGGPSFGRLSFADFPENAPGPILEFVVRETAPGKLVVDVTYVRRARVVRSGDVAELDLDGDGKSDTSNDGLVTISGRGIYQFLRYDGLKGVMMRAGPRLNVATDGHLLGHLAPLPDRIAVGMHPLNRIDSGDDCLDRTFVVEGDEIWMEFGKRQESVGAGSR